MITRAWLLVLVLMVASGLASCVSAVPLPPGIKIVPPTGGMPTRWAAFSGKWTGWWEDGIEHVLVVEEVRETEALVIYGWGPSPSRSFDAGWRREHGTFECESLVLRLPRPAVVSYRLRPDGKLEGWYIWNGGVSRAVLVKDTPR